jgi:hypothetical protein
VYIESRKALEFKMVRAKNIDILREPRASDPDAVSVRRSSPKWFFYAMLLLSARSGYHVDRCVITTRQDHTQETCNWRREAVCC